VRGGGGHAAVGGDGGDEEDGGDEGENISQSSPPSSPSSPSPSSLKAKRPTTYDHTPDRGRFERVSYFCHVY